ncbi:hypothetical protein QR680_007913 [Steinernema hermaphroditum]|uniref:Serpentine receptor class gamma n=1 Tax=Steinernema hermaphroditum TaxID=289476 RepID=A0AA39IH39_9BILA|nr:hypothetical protein QR680_007913 [Steinernema hermaphroditum]
MIPLHVEIIYLLVGIPSFVFYVAVIATLLRGSNKDVFGFAFYRIFAVTGIMDCFNYVINTITYRFPMCPTFSLLYVNFKRSFVTTFFYFALFFCGYFQIHGHTLMALNRLSTVACPSKHKTFWTSYYVHCIAVVTFLAFAGSWQNLFSNAEFARHEVNGTEEIFFTFKFDEDNVIIGKPTQFNSIMNAATYIFVSLLQLAMNIATVVLLVRQNKRAKAASVKRASKPEMNLFFLSVAMFFIGLTMGVYQVGVTLLLFAKNEAIVGFLNNYLWIADLNQLSPPYLLFLASATARKTILQSFGLKKRKKKESSALFVTR